MKLTPEIRKQIEYLQCEVESLDTVIQRKIKEKVFYDVRKMADKKKYLVGQLEALQWVLK
jgi:hypothetical protein